MNAKMHALVLKELDLAGQFVGQAVISNLVGNAANSTLLLENAQSSLHAIQLALESEECSDEHCSDEH